MTYRVVKVQIGDKTHYEIEYKWLFWWFSETDFACSIDGLGADYNISFQTVELAQSWIAQQFEKRTVC